MINSKRQGEINWNDVIKKVARDKNDEELGEVQEVGINYIFVLRGLINKEKFYIPYSEVESYDGNTLRFKLSKAEIKSSYLRGSSPNESIVSNDTDRDEKGFESESNSESTILPLTGEKLSVSKTVTTYKVIKIIKEPITETKEIEVPVTREELILERRPIKGNTPPIENLSPPVTSRQEIRIPLRREEVEVRKEAYVKEEVVVKKKSAVETKVVTEEIRSEKLQDRSQDILEASK